MFQKHIHKVKFYPSADDFTQALLVMLVTNITSVLAVQIQRQSNANLGQIGLMWIQDQLAAQLATTNLLHNWFNLLIQSLAILPIYYKSTNLEPIHHKYANQIPILNKSANLHSIS